MLQQSVGEIPPSKHGIGHDDPKHAGLKSLVTHGGIVTNTMGLGKIFLSLLFVNYMALYRKPTFYKPTLVLAPNGVLLNQWLKAIYRNFLDLAIVIAHGEKPSSMKFANAWVLAYAITLAASDHRL